MMKALSWLLGLDNALSIEQIDPSLAAPWASESRFWLFAGALALIVGVLFFYLKLQRRGAWYWRAALGASRGLLLVLLLVTLANPVLRLSLTNIQKPLIYVLFDGTDSMAMVDEYTPDQKDNLNAAVGLQEAKDEAAPRSRMDYVKALVTREQANLLKRLEDEKQCRVEAFLFDGQNTSQLRKLKSSDKADGRFDPQSLAQQLTTKGQVTALGAALGDVGQQFGAGNLAAVVMVSDFANNAGPPALGSTGQDPSPATRLHAPLYTVGVGAVENVDLEVDLQADPKMKRAEKTVIKVWLKQTGLQDRTATVRISARKLSGETLSETSEQLNVGEKTVQLTSAREPVEFPFTPQEAGRFEFLAEVEPLEGEVVTDNNRASRDVYIIDDYLRLMYVAYEPTWEWRFVKEVFHRDKLVGMQGFRTYLASSDPQVREANQLFLPTLTPKRSQFFANDVIFLDDMPRKMLSDRFCEMVQDFVGKFGHGLVVIAGPRFGPAELHGTPLAKMLPVIVDPDAKFSDARDFRLRLTPHASRYPFMQLGENDVETAKAWDNLGRLAWYQPVANLRQEDAFALAEHPTDTCRDGKTPQPLIAIGRYGNGYVVYLGFNEMWRLRRLYGEKHYRTFWSQLIYHLGMRDALGADKRFVVRTDRQQYRVEDKVTLTVDAYDENFEPLSDEDLPQRTLAAELTVPGRGGAADETRELTVSMLRKGVFEARIPVYTAGESRVRVKDPITSNYREVRFEVTDLSAERRSAVRNVRLQEDLASETHGKTYDLTTVSRLVDDLEVKAATESYTRSYPLWSTPLWFIALVGLMLGEWLFRKLIHLT